MNKHLKVEIKIDRVINKCSDCYYCDWEYGESSLDQYPHCYHPDFKPQGYVVSNIITNVYKIDSNCPLTDFNQENKEEYIR